MQPNEVLYGIIALAVLVLINFILLGILHYKYNKRKSKTTIIERLHHAHSHQELKTPEKDQFQYSVFRKQRVTKHKRPLIVRIFDIITDGKK